MHTSVHAQFRTRRMPKWIQTLESPSYHMRQRAAKYPAISITVGAADQDPRLCQHNGVLKSRTNTVYSSHAIVVQVHRSGVLAEQ